MHEIDVVLPFHRVDDYLKRTVQSLRNVRDVNLRIVAVNDSGSSIEKDAIGLLESDLLIENNDHGYLQANAIGVASTTRQYIGFQDSDDLTDPHRFNFAIQKLIDSNCQIVTGKLTKFISGNVQNSNFNLMGQLPQVKNQRLLWLLGTHGADSSLVGEGELIRKTWAHHSNYDPKYADFGWMMSLKHDVQIRHEERAIYLYRMHPDQFSRKQDMQIGWEKVYKVWKETLSSVPELEPVFSKCIINDKVALALVMPSSAVVLDKFERNLLYDFKRHLLNQLILINSPDISKWEYTLNVRLFLASRGRYFPSWVVIPKLSFQLTRAFLSGYKIRFGNKK